MDDFESGPQDFILYLDSKDDGVTKNSTGFSVQLSRPLNLSAGTWKVALRQLIFKQNFPTLGNMSYVTPASKGLYIIPQPSDDTRKSMLTTLNKSMPNALKGTSFSIDRNGKLYLQITNAQIKIQSPFLAKFLGFKENTLYPEKLFEQVLYIYAPEQMIFDNTLKIEADFVTPQMYSSQYSQVLAIDTVPNNSQVLSYHYNNPVYTSVFGSFFSSVNIKILDLSDKKFTNVDENFPIILKLHFQKQSL